MRQIQRAGEKLFVDFAGPTLGLSDGSRAHIFVAALGAYFAVSFGLQAWMSRRNAFTLTGAIVIGLFLRSSTKAETIPVHDPRILESIHYHE